MVLRKRMKKIVFIYLMLMVSSGAFCQRNVLRYADVEFDLKRFEHAGSEYSKAYSKKKSYYAAKRAAECYTAIKSYEKSYEWWFKAIEFPESVRSDYMSYARARILSGRDLNDSKVVLTSFELDLVYKGLNIPIDNGIKFIPHDKYNMGGSDYGIRSGRKGEFYFVSDRALEGETEKKSVRLDLRKRFAIQEHYQMNDRGFHGIFKDSGNGKIVPVTVDLEDVFHLSLPSFFEKGSKSEVIFTAVLREKVEQKNKIELYPGLYRANVNEEGNFVSTVALPFNNLSKYSVMHGFVFENRLYFSSDMPGGFGGFDLYFSELKEDGYLEPINLGPVFNSDANEVFPFVHNGILYFSSDRVDGLGGLDLYLGELSLKSGVKNMGIPYNSNQDDFAYFEDESGMKYISSDRTNGESRDDIYILRDNLKLRVLKENDEEVKELQDLILKFRNKEGVERTVQWKSGKVDGVEENEGVLEVSRKGYFPAKYTLDPGDFESEFTYKMIPIPYNKVLALDTIYYDLDAYAIRPDAIDVLEKAVQFLKIFPDFGLNITSHTDSRATKSYNERLSKRRSQSVSKFLTQSGIEGDRISMDWKGNMQPLYPCSASADCPEYVHQKNRRSVLSLEMFSDLDKEYDLPKGIDRVNSTEELIFQLRKNLYSVFDSLMGNPINNRNYEQDEKVNKVQQETNRNNSSVLKPNSTKVGDSGGEDVVIISDSELGSFFVIYESFNFRSAAVRRAEVLSKELDTNVYVIPPFGVNQLNYRLGIAKYSNLAEANLGKEKLKVKHKNEQIWVLEYRK
jgi:outer membrane protein OmpA-like peptidoglycan-associated protein/tetratricopeptide (TPR) repeat protein